MVYPVLTEVGPVFAYPRTGRCVRRLFFHIFDMLPLYWGFWARPLYHYQRQTWADTWTRVVVLEGEDVELHDVLGKPAL